MARRPKELERDVEVQDTPSGLQTRRVAAVKLRDLLPDPQNANKGTPRGRALLEDSLRRYGAGRSLLADKHGVLIAGNKTAEVAADIGLEDVIIVPSDGHQLVVVQRTDLDLTTDPAAKELAIADNRTSQVSLDWDVDVLQQVAGEGVDLSRFWTTDELDALLARAPSEGLTDPDAVPEERPTDIVRGDLFALGAHRLLCGDSTNAEDVARVMDGQLAVLVFSDPPYGISVVGGSGPTHFGKVGGSGIVNSAWYPPVTNDDSTKTAEQFYKACREYGLSDFVLWGGNYFTQFLPPSRCWIVWDKENSGNFADAELAWTSFNTGVELYRWMWNGLARKGERSVEGVSRVHPTQKPVGLHIEILKRRTVESDVFDGFLGSGATLIACEQLGRRCYAIEIEPRYVQVAIDRWEQFTGQKAQKL